MGKQHKSEKDSKKSVAKKPKKKEVYYNSKANGAVTFEEYIASCNEEEDGTGEGR